MAPALLPPQALVWGVPGQGLSLSGSQVGSYHLLLHHLLALFPSLLQILPASHRVRRRRPLLLSCRRHPYGCPLAHHHRRRLHDHLPVSILVAYRTAALQTNENVDFLFFFNFFYPHSDCHIVCTLRAHYAVAFQSAQQRLREGGTYTGFFCRDAAVEVLS